MYTRAERREGGKAETPAQTSRFHAVPRAETRASAATEQDTPGTADEAARRIYMRSGIVMPSSPMPWRSTRAVSSQSARRLSRTAPSLRSTGQAS